MDLELTEEEQRLLNADMRADDGFRYGMWALMFLLGASAVTLVWQSIEWLRIGEWPSVPARLLFEVIGMGHVRVSWAGFQKILEFIYDVPLAVLFLILAGMLVYVLTFGDNKEVPEALRTARMKTARKAFPRKTDQSDVDMIS